MKPNKYSYNLYLFIATKELKPCASVLDDDGLNERKMPKLPNKTEILLKTAQNKACFNDTQDIFVK